MENLKTPLDKKGRKLGNLTKVQRFYSEFNSDRSSSSSSLSSDEDDKVFSFENKSFRNTKLQNKLSNQKHVNLGSDLYASEQEKKKNVESTNLVPPVSPGLSANQDLKDKALDIIYQKKIRELKSNPVYLRLALVIFI